VEFGLLGPLEVTDGGQAVPIPSAKQRTLLACQLRAGEPGHPPRAAWRRPEGDV